MQWTGMSTDQLGTLETLTIQATPAVIAFVWALVDRIRNNIPKMRQEIIERVAQILAADGHPAPVRTATAAVNPPPERNLAMKRILAILVLAPVLAGCASVQKANDSVITVISRLNNTAIADLQQAQLVAKAATPPDTDGVSCAQGAVTVLGQINAVLVAAKSPASGAFTQAELLSLFAPNSPQYNQVKDTLTSACAAKVAKVVGAAQATLVGGVVGVLATTNVILPLAAASL